MSRGFGLQFCGGMAFAGHGGSPAALRAVGVLDGRGAWGGWRPGTGGANHISVPPPRRLVLAAAGSTRLRGRAPVRAAAHAAWLVARRMCPSRMP